MRGKRSLPPHTYSLAEPIEKETHTPLITDDVWERAKQKVFQTYSISTSIDYLRNGYLYPPSALQPVAQLSQKMQAGLMKWHEKGYHVSAASIRFIVAWKPKTNPEEEESAVMLPDLTLRKS